MASIAAAAAVQASQARKLLIGFGLDRSADDGFEVQGFVLRVSGESQGPFQKP